MWRCSVLSVAIGSRAQNSLELKDVTPAYPTAPLLIITAVFEEKFQTGTSKCSRNSSQIKILKCTHSHVAPNLVYEQIEFIRLFKYFLKLLKRGGFLVD